MGAAFSAFAGMGILWQFLGFGALKGADRWAFVGLVIACTAGNVVYLIHNLGLVRDSRASPAITLSYTNDIQPFGLLVCPTGDPALGLSTAITGAHITYAPSLEKFITAAHRGGGVDNVSVSFSQSTVTLPCPACPDFVRGDDGNMAQPCVDLPLYNATFAQSGWPAPAPAPASAGPAPGPSPGPSAGSTGAGGGASAPGLAPGPGPAPGSGMQSAANGLFKPNWQGYMQIQIFLGGRHARPANSGAWFVFGYLPENGPASALGDFASTFLLTPAGSSNTISVSQTRHVKLDGSSNTTFHISSKMFQVDANGADAITMQLAPVISIGDVVNVRTEVLGYGPSELLSSLLALANTCLAVVAFIFPTTDPGVSVPRYAMWSGGGGLKTATPDAADTAAGAADPRAGTGMHIEMGAQTQTNPALEVEMAETELQRSEKPRASLLSQQQQQ